MVEGRSEIGAGPEPAGSGCLTSSSFNIRIDESDLSSGIFTHTGDQSSITWQ